MKNSRKIIVGIFVVLAVLILGGGLWNCSIQSAAKDALTIQMADGTEKKVALADIRTEKKEAELKKKVGDPVLHTYDVAVLSEVLADQGVDLNEIDEVIVEAEDNFQVTLTAEEVLENENVFLALTEDGETLKNLDGDGEAPMLVVLKDEFSSRWAKSIVKIFVK